MWRRACYCGSSRWHRTRASMDWVWVCRMWKMKVRVVFQWNFPPQDFLNRRKVTEFGNLALVERREPLEGGSVTVKLAGVQRGDMSTRHYKPEFRVSCVRFSPTGLSWAAACTEGLMVYSLDKGIVFDPYQLSQEVTPKATRDLLAKEELSGALIMALKLNEVPLIHQVIESVPLKDGKSLACLFLPYSCFNSIIGNELLFCVKNCPVCVRKSCWDVVSVTLFLSTYSLAGFLYMNSPQSF